MNYIGEGDVPIPAENEECASKRLLEFNTDTKKWDFYLTYKIAWDLIEAQMFEMEIGNGKFNIPSGLYVMIGDDYGEIDWIMIDELFSRPLSISTLDTNFKNWGCSEPRATGVYEGSIFWPSTKHIIPVVDNETVILVSEKDQHNRTGAFQVEMFTGA